MVRKFVAVLFALALIGASVSAAQVSIGVGGQYLSLSGSDFDGIDAGFGVEGNAMFPVGQSIKLGVSGQWSTHGISGATESFKVLGVLAEGRYLFTMAGKATPYLAARGGWAQYSVSSGGQTLKATGFPFGGGVGVIIAMTPTLGIDLNAIFHTVSFGEGKVSGTVVAPEVSGTALQVRAGVNFKLGGSQ